LELLDMKSKKVYVYVIIVIWNFIRCPLVGQQLPLRGPTGRRNRKRDGF